MAKTKVKAVKAKTDKPLCVLEEDWATLRVYLKKDGIYIGGKPRDVKAFSAGISKGSRRKLRKALREAGRIDLMEETL